ncbi:DUF5313 family protein [Rhodococcus tukisamuensis]|uniref:DUF5313 domain-containing protein n=1 Tax=Rhodococcus tukisamuensis TaxID=168276 RepID=A0A1G6SIS5_9NOCA|nr:DUF5313 family protein [Rhodococcus tukisamuensis]SDD16693.1 hypothetical protein SAMN05444580_103156 [Rhodococcus tukisamuensis]
MSKTRPNPVQWIAYACGAKLPESMNDWVLNDITGDHYVVRHLVRAMVPFVPLFVIFMLFPGPLWLRGSMVLLGVLLALFYSVVYIHQNRARRLQKNGLPMELDNPRRKAAQAAKENSYSDTWR